MRTIIAALSSAAVLALAGCATPTPPVQVTRFHLDRAFLPDTVLIEPLPSPTPPGLEFQTYAAAVGTELTRLGFRTAPGPANTRYLTVVGFSRTTRDATPPRSPVSVGLGGGGYSGGYRGGGVGLGGGISFPIGHPRRREIVFSRLSVQIRDRATGTALWEGNAQTAAALNGAAADAPAVAAKLAQALFAGFPGESGRTIDVR